MTLSSDAHKIKLHTYAQGRMSHWASIYHHLEKRHHHLSKEERVEYLLWSYKLVSVKTDCRTKFP
jgi:hypothetical protein